MKKSRFFPFSKRKAFIITIFFFALSWMAWAAIIEGPGFPNVSYSNEEVSTLISQNNLGKAISSVITHHGYLVVPLGADNGGGVGDGALAILDISNPEQPETIFDSRDYPDIYHRPSSDDYFGDFAEIHSLPALGDLLVISERGALRGGFSILDPTPAYDDDPETLPRIISRFDYPGVGLTTNYDGYSFSLATQGGKYVYSPTGASGLYITDISDPENPVFVNHLSVGELGNRVMRAAVVIGNWLILSNSEVDIKSDVQIYNISNPEDPFLIGKVQDVRLGYQGMVYGSEFFGMNDGPIVSYDFSDPTNIQQKQYHSTAGEYLIKPEYGFARDDKIYIGHYPGMIKFDLNTTDGPVLARVEPSNPFADDYAFITPLGNMIIVASDHNHPNKLNFGIHQAEPDEAHPDVKFIYPKPGATNIATNGAIGIAFTDFVDPLSINETSIQLKKVGSEEVISGTYSHMLGIVNFIADSSLEENTNYEVVLKQDGVKDWVGNAYPTDRVVTTFSTGNDIIKLPIIGATTPIEVGNIANFTIDTSGIGDNEYEYSWSFGDGSPNTTFSTSLMANHLYTNAGNHTVTLFVKLNETNIVQRFATQIVHEAISNTPPQQTATIALDEQNNLVWNVNPDNQSIAATNINTFELQYEIQVGKEPSTLALGAGNTLYAIVQGEDKMIEIDRSNGEILQTIHLPYGSRPFGIIADTNKNEAYVSLQSKGELVSISLSDGTINKTEYIAPEIKHMAYIPSQSELYINRFISPEEEGEVYIVNTENLSIDKQFSLAVSTDPDTENSGRGLPNYLGGLAISPDLKQGIIPAKKDNIFRGLRRDGNPLNFEHTVRSIACFINVNQQNENFDLRIDFDNEDFPTAALYSPLGNQIYVAINGTSRIYVIDAYNPESKFSFSTDGMAPDGMAISADGKKLYVHNFLSRSVSVFDMNIGCNSDCNTITQLAKIKTVTNENLQATVLRGKQLFYNSKDIRLAQDNYMSCASCHLHGGNDGRTWDISNLGEGFRNTIDLRGKGGTSHGRLHWSANFDEVQDFEIQIRELNSGAGLMSDEDYTDTQHPLNDPPKTGRSSDLDALAAYVNSLSEPFKSPYTNNGELTATALEGQLVFERLECNSCHSGAFYTDSPSDSTHDIGTIKPTSGNRLGGPLTALDAPTLRGLWLTAPYLHDGSAKTIKEAVLAHENVTINTEELEKLEAFLLQLGSDFCDVEVGTLCDDGNPFSENDAYNENCQCVGEVIECEATGVLSYEIWNDIPGVNISDLTEHPSYNFAPDEFQTLTYVFESYRDYTTNAGTKISGILCPPVSGKYRFWVSGNDESQLFLSENSNPEDAELIAHVPTFSYFRSWNQFPEQQSEEIILYAGKQYYIEAINKEGNGADHLSVGWQLPNGQQEFPIPADYFSLPKQWDCNITSLNDLPFAEDPINGIGPVEFNQSNGSNLADDGDIMTIGGETYKEGIGVHAKSKLIYDLNGNYEQFNCFVGVQDDCILGSASARILLDGQEVFNSGLMLFGQAAIPVNLDVSAANRMELIVSSGIIANHCAQVNWVNTRLYSCTSCFPQTSCDDGDSCTINDVITADCLCQGELLDTNNNNECDLLEVVSNTYDNADIKIELYPNPTSGFFIVKLPRNSGENILQVYNINGEEVHQTFVPQNGELGIDLSGFACGMYFIRTEINGVIKSGKVVLQ